MQDINFYNCRDADATHVFHAFHEGSSKAYKQLAFVEKNNQIQYPGEDPTLNSIRQPAETNVGAYEYTVEEVNILFVATTIVFLLFRKRKLYRILRNLDRESRMRD